MVWNNLVICFGIFVIVQGVGDIVGVKTRGVLSGLFVAVLIFLVGFWTNIIPASFIETAGISQGFTMMALVVMVISASSNISLQVLKRQWKTCIIAVVAVAFIVLFCLTIGRAILGETFAVVSAAPIAGGMSAAVIMADAAIAAGQDKAAALAYMIFFAQSIIGYPILSNLARGEMKRRVADYRNGTIEYHITDRAEAGRKKWIPAIPSKYNTSAVILGKVFVIAILGTLLSNATNGKVHQLVWCLLLTIVAVSIGFIEPDCVKKANCFGLISIIMVGTVVYGLRSTTPQEFLSLLGPLVIILVVGIVGLVVGSVIIGKLLKVNWRTSIIISWGCLCGFPFNIMTIEESARINSETPEEYDYLTKSMVPDATVGAIVSVTICSILVAGILAKMV